MTEDRMESSMEQIGDAIEKTVEGAAKLFDKSITRAFRLRPVRLTAKALSLFTGAGLIVKAYSLSESGNERAAKACLAGGVLVISAELIQTALLRKK